jgi:hypothetical protein
MKPWLDLSISPKYLVWKLLLTIWNVGPWTLIQEWLLLYYHFLSYRSCAPVKSIKDIGSLLHPVWNFPAGEVGGKQWSLNDVEDYLRNPQPLKWVRTLLYFTLNMYTFWCKQYSSAIVEILCAFEWTEATTPLKLRSWKNTSKSPLNWHDIVVYAHIHPLSYHPSPP